MLDPHVAMIDRLLEEGPIGMAEAARLLPSIGGRRLHATTVVVWITRGKRGVYLEGYRGSGKSWLTSRQAVVRFLAAITSLDSQVERNPTQEDVDEDSRRRLEVARARLSA